MKHIIYNLIFIVLSISFGNGVLQAQVQQKNHVCGINHLQKQIERENPEAKAAADKALQRLMKQASAYLERRAQKRSDGDNTMNPITIPVVVHVIYGCEDAIENVADQRVYDAIAKLNDHFKGTKLEACGCEADCEPSSTDESEIGCMENITFRLAQKDPSGNPTTGINRVKSDLTYVGAGNSVELAELVRWDNDAYMWDRSMYLNVFVLNKATAADNSGIAFFPDGTDEANLHSDAVNMAHWAFSPIAAERLDYINVLAHEVGHWLGLRHIWGGSNKVGVDSNCQDDDFDFLRTTIPNVSYPGWDVDLFDDTPNTKGNSTINNPAIGCDAPGNCSAEPEMLDNFMDYTECGNMFSKGQVAFMNSVLNSDVADRKNLHTSTNIAATLYNSDEPRLVFQRNRFYEKESNNGEIENTLMIKLEGNAKFSLAAQTGLTSYFTTSGNLSGLTVSWDILSDTEAELILSGTSSIHTNNINFDIEFDAGAFQLPSNSIPSISNRSKTLKIDYIEEEGMVYQNQDPTDEVGPNTISQGTVLFNNSQRVYISYEQDGSYYASINVDGKIRFALDQGLVRVYKLGDVISENNDFNSEENELDLSTVADGEEFYLGVRFEKCDLNNNPIYKLGWIRCQRINEPGCERILIKDYAYRSDYPGVGVVTITAGQLDDAVVAFSENTLTEMPDNNGTFNEIEIDLKNFGSNGFSITGIFNPAANYYTLSPLNDASIPAGFENHVEVEVVGFQKAIVRINPNYNLGDEDHFSFILNFNSNAFTNGVPGDIVYGSDGKIRMKFKGEPGFFYQSYLNEIVGSATGSEKSFFYTLDFLDYSRIENGLIAYNDGFIFYKPYNIDYRIEIFCETGSDPAPIRLFELSEFQTDYFIANNPLANGEFREPGGGGYSNDGSEPVAGEMMLTHSMINNWKNSQGNIAYLYAKVIDNCDEAYYGWIRLTFNDDGSVEIGLVIFNQEANTETWDEFTNCATQGNNASVFLFIDKVQIENGIYNDQTDPADPLAAYNNYTDYTQMTSTVTAGQALDVNLYQGNSENTNPYDGYWYIWIDKNNDGFFLENDGELLLQAVSENVDGQITIPADLSSGSYTLRIFLSLHPYEFGCGSFQYGEAEDYTITIGTDPNQNVDIFLTEVSVSNLNPSVGESITISCTQNVLNATVSTLNPNPHVQFYLSDNTTLDASDANLGYEFSTIGSSNSSESESRNPTIDSSWGIGTKYILIIADANDDHAESDETNNFAYIEINIQEDGLPDLHIGARSVSNTSPSVGESIRLACFQKVANASVDKLIPYPDVKYYLSDNTTYSSNDLLLGSDASVIGTTDPDNYEFIDKTVQSSWGTGIKYILFRADANNEHQESNENNNVKYVQINIQDSPDLFIGARSVSNTSPSVGESIRLACFQKVANASVGALSPNPDVKYYLSNNTTYSSNDILLGSDASIIGTSNPDNYEFIDKTVQSSWGTGIKYILFRADANNEHPESNENNNVKYVQITIQDPCSRPVNSSMTFGYACNGKGLTLKTTNTYTGQNRKFRYKEHGTSTWTETDAATGNIAVTSLKICTLYNVQLKVQCDSGVWSAYSPTKNAWTRAAKPLTSEIDAEILCSGTSGYLYCFSHNGDKKIFRYRTLGGSWSSWLEPAGTDHFVSISGLSHSTQYQYQVKVKCGTTGVYSCAQSGSFTTPDANTCKIIESSNNFNVYPNPAKDLINVDLDINERVETIKIYNLQGRLVKEWNTQEIEGTSFQLNLSELNKGMYMLRINETHIKKISKL